MPLSAREFRFSPDTRRNAIMSSNRAVRNDTAFSNRVPGWTSGRRARRPSRSRAPSSFLMDLTSGSPRGRLLEQPRHRPQPLAPEHCQQHRRSQRHRRHTPTKVQSPKPLLHPEPMSLARRVTVRPVAERHSIPDRHGEGSPLRSPTETQPGAAPTWLPSCPSVVVFAPIARGCQVRAHRILLTASISQTCDDKPAHPLAGLVGHSRFF